MHRSVMQCYVMYVVRKDEAVVRDGPSWAMRLWDPADQSWAEKSPWHRILRVTTIGESDAGPRRWVLSSKLRCGCVLSEQMCVAPASTSTT